MEMRVHHGDFICICYEYIFDSPLCKGFAKDSILASFSPNLDHQNFAFSNRKKFAVLKVECAVQYAALLVIFQHRLTHVSSGI